MREKSKKTLDAAELLNEDIKYAESLALDYCGFRLKSLADRIKSECLKLRKAETHLINP